MDQDGTNADEGENMEIEPENFIVNDEILDSHSYGVNKVIPCELCQQMFTNKVKLTLHWIINHAYKPCQLCSNMAFKYDSDKIQHEQQHLPFGCSSCSHEFNTVQEEQISEHYKSSHGSFLCKFCSSVVHPVSMYSDHLHKKHNVTVKDVFDLNHDLLELQVVKKNSSETFLCKLCNKKRKMSLFSGHYLFHHNMSIHAFQKMIEKFPNILINGTILNDHTMEDEDESTTTKSDEDAAKEEKEDDDKVCQVCDTKVDGDDSKVHGVFCKGLVICKEKQCEQLFKDGRALSSHVKFEHPLTTCKFGCSDKKLKTDEIDSHLEKLHDIVECYMCDIVNSSGSFNSHLRDKHSVNIESYEKAVARKGVNSKLFRVEICRTKDPGKKKKVLCNLCDQDITDNIRDFSFINHYRRNHQMKIEAIIRNLAKNPIVDLILNEKQQRDFMKNFNIEVEDSCEEMVEFDFDTSKVSCVGNDDHLSADKSVMNCVKCEFCKVSFEASCHLYSHMQEQHGFKLSNVKDYCTTCEINIGKSNEENEEAEEDIKDFNLSLVCPLDQSYHVTKNNYKDHMLYDHANPEVKMDKLIYKCLECNFTYNEIDEIRKHFKKVHPAIQTIFCRICRLKFNDLSDSNSHFGENHLDKAKKNYSCKLCSKSFKQENTAKSHYETRHAKKSAAARSSKSSDKAKGSKLSFKCQVCDEFFANNQDRKLHLLIIHPDTKVFKCSLCPSEFRSKGSLSSHKSSYHNKATHTCEHCQKEFSRRDSYKEHLLIHSSLRHQCAFCEKNFVQRSNLIRHERIHNGEKPYQCAYCPKAFSDKGACKSHENVHTQASVTWCDICGAQYSKKQKLKYHMRKHTLENVMTCDRCKKICTDPYSYKKHMETHQKRSIECEHCFKRFKTSRSLKSHVRCEHNFDETLPFIDTKIVCTLCNHAATNSMEIEAHLKTVHTLNAEVAAGWQNFVRNVEFEMGDDLVL